MKRIERPVGWEDGETTKEAARRERKCKDRWSPFRVVVGGVAETEDEVEAEGVMKAAEGMGISLAEMTAPSRTSHTRTTTFVGISSRAERALKPVEAATGLGRTDERMTKEE